MDNMKTHQNLVRHHRNKYGNQLPGNS